ncbi:hypothetical protein THAOC_05782 [Thalassiosira oceanica]|uniref:Uncharacterized protein n=1 Tax=Thalassiosira oceanica TaxID=159749 RepID=K0T4V3_THAOC|nr:hypothetical protein THAOC_05782 [Thalassiosira oceanica]|eukprot:EJK72665.1 hypothetical protein THAOC_05782 [Thalassiosira oceanica]
MVSFTAEVAARSTAVSNELVGGAAVDSTIARLRESVRVAIWWSVANASCRSLRLTAQCAADCFWVEVTVRRVRLYVALRTVQKHSCNAKGDGNGNCPNFVFDYYDWPVCQSCHEEIEDEFSSEFSSDCEESSSDGDD